MATRIPTTSAPRLNSAGFKALAIAAFAAFAILVAFALVNAVSDDETAATLTPETPVAVPVVVNEGIPPRGGLGEAIQEQQAPAAPATVHEGVPPRGGLSETIEEQRSSGSGTSCDGSSQIAGIC